MTKKFNQPLGGNEMPRFGAPATFMRLPTQATAKGLDACFVGVPMDIGTSNRPGTRFGPRQIRAESCFVRPYNMASRAAPFDSLQVADIGDVAIDTFNLPKCMDIITEAYDRILAEDCIPLTLGGDHTIAYPILRAIAKKHGPVGLIHVDAHADINEHMFGEPIAHGTPFRRAVEAGVLDTKRCIQIGLRGSGYAADDFDWPRQQGFRVVQAEECWWKSLTPLMEEVRAQMGDGPGLSLLRHRQPRPRFCAGHRHAGDRRADDDPGAGDHPRLLGAQSRRLRPGRGVAALRHIRQHRADGGLSAVRDALRAAGRRAASVARARRGRTADAGRSA